MAALPEFVRRHLRVRVPAVVYALAHVLLLPATFVAALVVAVLTHLSSAPLRRDVVVRVNAILEQTFVGHVTITSIGHISLRSVTGVSARVTDAAGKPVLSVDGVSASLNAIAILKSALPGAGPITIDLSDASVHHADVSLDADATGLPAIANVWASKTPPPAEPAPPGRGVRFAIDHVALDHAWVHGLPQGPTGIAVDADLDDLAGAVLVDSPHFTLDLSRVHVLTRGMPSGANANGALEAHLALPSPQGGAMAVNATWKGALAGIDETVHASVDGDALDAVVDVPAISPDAIRGLWPASTIGETATAHVEAHGTLTHANVAARLSLGGATFDVSGPVAWAGGQRADLRLAVHGLDANAIVLTAPPTKLEATGDVTLMRKDDGSLGGKVELELGGGTVAGQKVPPGSVHATVAYDKTRGLHGDATINAREPGAPTVLAVHVATSRTGALEVTFDGDSHAPDLKAIPRLGLGVLFEGRSTIKTHGVLDVTRNLVDASAQVELDDIGQTGVVHVQHLSLEAGASGTLKAPQLDITARGFVLDVAGYRFSHVHIEAHGPPTRSHVSIALRGDNTPEVDAELDVSLEGAPTVTSFEATVRRGADQLHVSVERVRLGRGEIDLDGADVEGLGSTLHASFRLTQTTLSVKSDAKDLDLATLARIVGVADGLEGCRLAVDVDASLRRDAAEGRAAFNLSSCSLGKVKGATARLDATMKDRTIAGQVHLEVPGAGTLDFVTTSLLVGGKAPVVASLRRVWGKVKFGGRADLAKVAALLPPRWVPVNDIRGNLVLSGALERDGMDDMTPGVVVSLETQGLSLVAPSTRKTDVNGSTTFVPPAWRADGLDVALDVHVDGDSGFADVSARLVDPKGELVTLDLKSATVPFANILATPAQAASILEQIQMNARVAIPERDVATLPAMLAIKGARGKVEAVATMTGSALKPLIDARLKLSQVRARAAGLAIPVDFDLTAHYDGDHADAELTGDARKARVLDAKVSADANAAELLRGDTSSWKVSGAAHLEAMPIEALAALSDHQVKGTVTGDLSLDRLHSDASAKAALRIDGLKVGDVAYKSGTVTMAIDGTSFQTTAHLDQDDGSIDAHVQAAARWGKALAPTLDAAHDLDCAITAKRFRAALLLPFVDTMFTELDARIDANLKATLDPRSRSARLDGTVNVDSGRFELASIGGEFHDASMKLTFTPDGVVKVENVKAMGMSGRIEAAATARLDNLQLSAANATVLIPDSAPLLLTVEGSQVGTLVGNMSVVAKVSGDKSTMNVAVSVPKLHVELPLTSSRNVQVLGDIDGVRIGTVGAKGFVPEQLDAPKQALAAAPGRTLVVAVDLGRDVLIKRGGTLKITLSGKPTITVDDAVHASGQIKLVRGTLDVQGKAFSVENGTVSFVGDDPSNPQVVVTATWDAPDGTRVYADFVGPLKTGKVTLRSEPSLPNNEILALILFGTPDGLTPASQGGGTSQASTGAAGVAGSAAAQPLNQALESYGLGGVTTRVDTSTANPRPEVEVQIARDISLQVAYVIGTPPPGTNPDSTLFTLNWRFIRQWSLETTIGSAGTSIMDLIWQYRY